MYFVVELYLWSYSPAKMYIYLPVVEENAVDYDLI